MSDSLARPVALVTGASDRIGAAIAARLAHDGYAVAVHCCTNVEGAAEVAGRIGGGARVICCDLTSPQARDRLMADAMGLMGAPVTLLVNNASVFARDWAGDVRDVEWDAHFDLHAKAPVLLAQHMVKLLGNDAFGHVINVIDERVLHPSPAYFSYGLSKGVLATATTTLAQSFAPWLRVNAIAPGPILPHEGRSQDEFIAVIADLPLQRAASLDDVGEAVSFLDRMKAMTGQIIALDGGRSVEYHPRRVPTPRVQE